MDDYDVLIAGYGPTGAVAANLLGQKGVRVLVVEPNAEIFDIPRAVHFDGEVMRIFQSLDIADAIREVSAIGSAVGFTNGRNWNLFRQDLSDVPRHHEWANSYFFNQPALEGILRSNVERFECVDVSLGSQVVEVEEQGENVVVRVESAASEDREVRVNFVLGCDGASSTVRQLLKVPQEDLECDEPWLVCDWLLPEGTEIDRCAYQICDPKRPTTLVPCESGHIRWEFMLNSDDTPDLLEDEETVRGMMAPHVARLSPNLDASDGDLIRAKVYTFHALMAENFRQGRVFLLGDSAHQMPPFLGQGMCAGIRDAHNLCWKLTGVLRQDYTPELLDTYTSERRPHVYEVIKTAVGHGGVIQNRSHILAFFRDCFLKLGSFVPALIGFLRFDLSWPLGAGLFASEERGDGTPVGLTFPQFAGSDNRLGDGYCLVVLDQSTKAIVDSCDLSEDLVCHTVNSLTDDPDGQKAFGAWFANYDATAILIRPDRYVYGISTSRDRGDVIGLVRTLQNSVGIPR